MIEEIVLNYLKSNIPGVDISMERKKDLPKRYILIEKTGSGRENRIFNATIAIQSHAESLFEAAALNETVKGLMLEIDSLAEVCKVELNSDYNYTDGSTKQYRYQAVYDIKHF